MLNFKQFVVDAPKQTEVPTPEVKESVDTPKLWEATLQAIVNTVVENTTDTISEAGGSRGDNFNKQGKKNAPGALTKSSELDKVKNRHRDEDKRQKTRQRSERERAEISDFRAKDLERKERERKRVEKIRQGVYECAFIEEVYSHLGNQKFEMLLRNGLTKRSDMIRFKLALEKLNNGQNPTLVERDIFFSVFNKIVQMVTEDPETFTKIHRKTVQTRA